MAHHLVALSGRRDMESMMDELIRSGCDVNATTQTNGDTVLHLVIANNPMKLAFSGRFENHGIWTRIRCQK